MRMTRRDLLRLSSASLLGLAIGEHLGFAAGTAKQPQKPLRMLILGGTGFTGRTRFVTRWRAATRSRCSIAEQPHGLAGRRRGTDRRPQHRRPEGARGPRVGRLHRQPDHLAVLGARRRPGAARPGQALHLHLDRLRLCRRRQTGRRRVGGARDLHRRRPDGRDDGDVPRQHGELYGPLKAVSEEEAAPVRPGSPSSGRG